MGLAKTDIDDWLERFCVDSEYGRKSVVSPIFPRQNRHRNIENEERK